jgi:hypothetical protein
VSVGSAGEEFLKTIESWSLHKALKFQWISEIKMHIVRIGAK